MTGDDYVVVANGFCQEVTSLTGVVKTDNLLRAAEVGLALATKQLAFSQEVAGEVTGDLDDSDRARLHIASDANAYARLEMGIEFETLYHVEGNGAVSKEHLACNGCGGVNKADVKEQCQNLCSHAVDG